MDKHIAEYYHEFRDGGSRGNFHKVLPLHLDASRSWEELSLLAPNLPRAWYELSHVSPENRIEFSQAHWMNQLPFHPKATAKLEDFFGTLDDIGIFLVQRTADAAFEAHQVYSLAGNSGFYWGLPPIPEDGWASLAKEFPGHVLPEDYSAFLQLHNGFGKHMDTGVLPADKVLRTFEALQVFLEQSDPLLTAWGDVVEPHSLIPFYESFDLHCYQCFWADWYPGPEMGNVYYSGNERSLTLRDPKQPGSDVIAFATFVEWLAFYVEQIT